MTASTLFLLYTVVLLTRGVSWMCAETLQVASSEDGIRLTEAPISINHHQWKTAEAQLRQYLAKHNDSPEAMYAVALTLLYER